jgi:hypothetical protein
MIWLGKYTEDHATRVEAVKKLMDVNDTFMLITDENTVIPQIEDSAFAPIWKHFIDPDNFVSGGYPIEKAKSVFIRIFLATRHPNLVYLDFDTTLYRRFEPPADRKPYFARLPHLCICHFFVNGDTDFFIKYLQVFESTKIGHGVSCRLLHRCSMIKGPGEIPRDSYKHGAGK